jgi:hypothetical protein
MDEGKIRLKFDKNFNLAVERLWFW